MLVRRGVEVFGIVQGVGFRPYVYRMASGRRLVGEVRNSPTGVEIEIQGELAAVEDFLARLSAEAPPLARVTGLRVRDLACNGDSGFRIGESSREEAAQTLISPDAAVCDDCLRELFDGHDRRHRYPFINCTNCGPRFTIVSNIPYDRLFTSMAAFTMCPACLAEYDDPADRRFHAQPNGCWSCGPQLALWSAEGEPIDASDPVAEAAARLRAGDTVAVKGLGGFHLAVDATNARAVARLRERKQRVDKPFAVMVPDVAAAGRLCTVDAISRELLCAPERPIVLMPRTADCRLPASVAPGNRDVGVFLPYTPLHHLLLADGGFAALVMTSGNLSEEPIAIDNQEAVRRLRGIADCLLVHDRDILLRCDDSVVRAVGGRSRQLRRSRGWVPAPVLLGTEQPSVLAVGGELKNTICLTRGRHAFLSQHIGDLENLETFRFFEQAIEHLRRILEIDPRAVACDLHPDYFSTRWALAQRELSAIGVQHHHAHIASCMAENGLDGEVIGIALDGTGYGTDGEIWGGEVLVAGFAGFQRSAHLRYLPMPGGAAAVHEPWRMALSQLTQLDGTGELALGLPFMASVERRKAELVLRLLQRGVNAPLTSSCGRLFDAVAAVAGVRNAVNYEAQAAIELEMLARDSTDSRAYPLALLEEGDQWIIDPRPLFEELVHDLGRSVAAADISRRFHLGLAQVLADVAVRLRARTGLTRICLSGGTFNNALLFERLEAGLEQLGFGVFSHRAVPAGDGGLSLGQAMVAAHRLRTGEG